MSESEKKLKVMVNNLFRIIRMNDYMKKASMELDCLLNISDYSLRIFEAQTDMSRYVQAKEDFAQMSEEVQNTYGSDIVSCTYNAFKAALDDEAFMQQIGMTEKISAAEKSSLFKKLFDEIQPAAKKWDGDSDCYSYFIEMLKEILMPNEEIDREVEEICPYCDGMPSKVLKADFFGPNVSDGDGYVYGCECGAYAMMDDKGRVKGKLGDTMLHQKRGHLKGAVCELCNIAGMTFFESCRWFSLITGLKIQEINDIEYLDTETCNLALRLFLLEKKELQDLDVKYPTSRNELFLFFASGGRLLVCNAFGFQRGKLLVPSEVGVDGIRMYGHMGSQTVSFTEGLKYEFSNDCMFIVHPTGKREKYRMMHPDLRTHLFELKFASEGMKQAVFAG